MIENDPNGHNRSIVTKIAQIPTGSDLRDFGNDRSIVADWVIFS